MAEVLAIGIGQPWAEPSSGSSIRQTQLLGALCDVARVTYLSLQERNSAEALVPHEGLVDLQGLTYQTAQPDRPRQRLTRRKGSAIPARFQHSVPPSRTDLDRRGLDPRDFDMVWLANFDSASIALPWVTEHKFVALDLYDREEDQLAQRMRQLEPLASGGMTNARKWAYYRREIRLWSSWTRNVAHSVTHVVVTKQADASGLGDAQIRVVPNGCSVPLQMPERPSREFHGPILFHGLMTYGPNLDGAEWLLSEIQPLILDQSGRTPQIRVVGEASPQLLAMADPPRTVVTGYVDDILPEVDNADVLVVPLRLGSGTRLKILEAFARGLPVVSTSVGCDGLGAEDGIHLLVADDAESIARAVSQVLASDELASKLRANGFRLAREQFSWERILGDFQEWVLEAIGSPAR